MKSLRLWLSPVVFLAFAAAGWQMRGGKESSPDPAAAASPATVKASQRGPRSAGKAGVPEDVRQRLAAIQAARSPVERLRATLALAHSLPVSEMERWYRGGWFDFHDDMDANLFYRITRARWLEEDPEGMMRFFLLRNNDKTHEMASLWAKRDPQAALAFLERLEDSAELRRIVTAMGGPLAAADPERAAAQVLRLHGILGGDNAWAVSELVAALAKNAPDLLERESAGWPAPLRDAAAKQLVRASLASDFAAGVAALRDEPDGKRRFLEAVGSDGGLLKAMAKQPGELPPGWFAEAALAHPYHVVSDDPGQWLDADLAALGFNDEQAHRLRNSAMNHLGYKDPDRALALLEGDSLEDSQRRNLLSNTLSHLARTDPERAEAWAARLTDPEEAALAKRTIEGALAPVTRTPPPEPADWLVGLADQDSSAMWQYIRRIESWDWEQVAAAAREFGALPEERKAEVAGKLVNSNWSGIPVELRAGAISHLLAHPAPAGTETPGGERESNPLLRSASELAVSWVTEDPIAAGRWVRGLPAGEERLWAARNLAARWAEYDPAGARQWAAGLPEAERQQILSHLEAEGGRGRANE